MFQKRMRRAALALLAAALLLSAPLQAAGWTAREAPGLLETAWGWLMEWVAATAADEVPTPPGQPPGGEPPPSSDDGGAIDPDG